MNAIDPDNLLQFRQRLNVAGEYLCQHTDDPKAREAYAAVLYVQSSLKLDAEEMRIAASQESDLSRIKSRIETRFNSHLCEMREGYDDSIVGFNEAWDIMREVFVDIAEEG